MNIRQLFNNLIYLCCVVIAISPAFINTHEKSRSRRRNILTSAVAGGQSHALPQAPLTKATTIHVDTTQDDDESLRSLQKLDAPPKSQTSDADDTTIVLPDAQEIEEDEKIEFNFENADFQNLVDQVALIFDVTFIPDDAIQPITQGGKALKGNKITFKTNNPLSRKDAWNLFTVFLNIGGFSLVPESNPSYYRITSIPNARTSPLPTFIGVEPELLPETDEMIRYLYFVENANITTLEKIIQSLRSPSSSFAILKDIKAFVLTDKAYSIKTLMKIIKELDKVAMPQSMSVLKLRRVDAEQVKKLYESLTQQDKQGAPTSRLFPQRKPPTSLYFPENTRIIAEPRTNALILLGPQNAIQKIEDFVTKYVDVDPDKPYSPLHIYQLKYANATTIANIMNNVTQFGKNTPAGISGGVRGEDKYIKSITFTPEDKTNQLIIRGEYEDYLKAKEIIAKLDEPQPQIAIEILILTVSLKDNKILGAQIRSKQPGVEGLLGKNVEFQTSGIRTGANSAPQGILENTSGSGAERLLANLLQLVNGSPAGNTIISLGADAFGVWGIFQALSTITSLQVVSNPFLIATNKTPASVSLGEIRRVVQAVVVGGITSQDSFGNEEAVLDVKITPQINSDGMIILDIIIKIEEFLNATDPTNANKSTREIKTQTIVADKEVLALGGLIENKITNELSKTPLLGDIPVLGWLFKNKRKSQDKSNLLILLSTRIIAAEQTQEIKAFTSDRVDDYQTDIAGMHDISERRDPVFRAFFKAKEDGSERMMDNFLFKRTKHGNRSQKGDNANGPELHMRQPTKNRVARRQQRRAERKKQQPTPLDTVVVAQAKPQTTTRMVKAQPSSITRLLSTSDTKVAA